MANTLKEYTKKSKIQEYLFQPQDKPMTMLCDLPRDIKKQRRRKRRDKRVRNSNVTLSDDQSRSNMYFPPSYGQQCHSMFTHSQVDAGEQSLQSQASFYDGHINFIRQHVERDLPLETLLSSKELDQMGKEIIRMNYLMLILEKERRTESELLNEISVVMNDLHFKQQGMFRLTSN